MSGVSFPPFSDLHTHTTYSDGKNTPREMIEAAISRGLSAIGISDHAFTAFDPSYCMPREKVVAYREELLSLKEEYRGKIEVLVGIEEDFYSDPAPEGFDYTIGSVHYLKFGDAYVPVDESKTVLLSAAKRFTGGDTLALAERYFDTVAGYSEKKPSIIGHFDLIRKFNRAGALFDESDPRYLSAARRAIDALLPLGVPFEINLGAIQRGYREEPYPAPSLLSEIRERGGRFLLSTDSHRAETVGKNYEKYLSLL